jgi:hypothetical protein
MKRRAAWVALVFGVALWAQQARHIDLRSRVHLFHAGDEWSEVRSDFQFDPAKSAVIVCDMWDKHWCTGANIRVAAIIKKLDPMLADARKKGMVVIHAPSDTMAYYAGTPQREAIRRLPHVNPPPELNLTAPPLPIDDSTGGCDTPGEKEHIPRKTTFQTRARRSTTSCGCAASKLSFIRACTRTCAF